MKIKDKIEKEMAERMIMSGIFELRGNKVFFGDQDITEYIVDDTVPEEWDEWEGFQEMLSGFSANESGNGEEE